jgi:hypothetical protein
MDTNWPELNTGEGKSWEIQWPPVKKQPASEYSDFGGTGGYGGGTYDTPQKNPSSVLQSSTPAVDPWKGFYDSLKAAQLPSNSGRGGTSTYPTYGYYPATQPWFPEAGTAPKGAMVLPSAPTLALPTYTAPVRNEARVDELTQKFTAPQVSRLQTGLSEALNTTRGTNPYVAKETARSAIRGYGEGLSGVAATAGQQAQSQYNQEFANEADQAKTNYQGAVTGSLADYQGKVSRINATYESAMKDWLRSRGGR